MTRTYGLRNRTNVPAVAITSPLLDSRWLARKIADYVLLNAT